MVLTDEGLKETENSLPLHNCLLSIFSLHTNNGLLQVFRCLPTDSVQTFQQMREFNAVAKMATANPTEALTHLAKVKGRLVLMPLHFLRDEILTPKMGQKEALLPYTLWT
jgi:hypothetical protein